MAHALSLTNEATQKISDELNHFLADTYILYLKTQNFHWNVTGPNFYSLHKLFEEQYLELAAAIDEIAERNRALGRYTMASFSQYLELCSIKEEKSEINPDNMVQKLMKDHQVLATHARQLIPKIQKAGDEGTADLLIQRAKSHEKAAWMLKSSL